MLKVFICEDDPEYLAFIEKQVTNYITMSNLIMHMVCSDVNPSAIIHHLEKSPSDTGLYFLGIHIKEELGGIKLAETIRKYDPRGFIVFLASDATSYKFIFKYKIEALDYIIKDDPYIEERIHECLDDAVKKFTAKATILQNNFVFKLSEDTKSFFGNNIMAKDSMVSVDSGKILCFMTVPDMKRTVIVHTIEGSFPVRGSLRQIEDEIDDARFYKCQSNLIINLDKVIALDPIQRILTLENNITINIATRKIKALNQRINEYEKNLPILAKSKNEYYELILNEVPLTDNNEPDFPAILAAHGLSHVNLSKAKVFKIDGEILNVSLLAPNANKITLGEN